MAHPTVLNLSIDPDKLTSFCGKLLKRSRDITKTHDALSTLEAFISVFSNTANHPQTYDDIKAILLSFSEQTRQSLLKENTERLIEALTQHNLAALTDVHSHLSRNGFYLILEASIKQLSIENITSVKNWSHDWVMSASQKAEQASGYPESYDFNSANIDIKEFQAMKDVSHFLNSI